MTDAECTAFLQWALPRLGRRLRALDSSQGRNVILSAETPSPASVGEGWGEGHLVRDVRQDEPSVSLALIVRLSSLRPRSPENPDGPET